MARINNFTKLNFSVFLKKIIFGINVLFAILLITSSFSRFINPSQVALISFIGLAFPIFFIINCCFILYWIFNYLQRIIYSTISTIIALPLLFTYFNIVSVDEKTENSIKIMSFNCQLFDLYNFENNTESRNIYYDFLRNENAQILCFQEFYTSEEKSNFNHLDSLQKLLKMNSHFENSYTLKNVYHYGTATFSKYPILAKGKIDFHSNSNNVCIFTDILIGKDTVRIYNAHLQSLQIVDVETIYSYKYKEKTSKIFSFKNRLNRFNLAFTKRAQQAKLIKEHIANCKYKTILCGDFNDTSSSFAYELLTNNLNDSFLEKGFGIGTTYNGKIPFQRIDYILYSNNIKCVDFEVKNEFKLSDHFPIVGHYFVN